MERRNEQISQGYYKRFQRDNPRAHSNDEAFALVLLEEVVSLFSNKELDMARLILRDIPSQQSRLYRVVSFQIVDKYTIEVEFDDGLTKTINLKPIQTIARSRLICSSIVKQGFWRVGMA
ncbi:MAG: hypothetical protein P8183_03005 [Anaerolineae bacterium]